MMVFMWLKCLRLTRACLDFKSLIGVKGRLEIVVAPKLGRKRMRLWGESQGKHVLLTLIIVVGTALEITL